MNQSLLTFIQNGLTFQKELHGFYDASQVVYDDCLYARTNDLYENYNMQNHD